MDKTTRSEPVAEVTATVNGRVVSIAVPVRKTLLDVLRDDLRLTGTHVGCEHGVCGCCDVLLNGQVVRSCLLLAVQVDACEVTTVEGLGTPDHLSPVQAAFADNHAMQCGYCTPGIVIAATAFLAENPDPTEVEIRQALAGNLCRCTGYMEIVNAVQDAAARLREGRAAGHVRSKEDADGRVRGNWLWGDS